MVKKKKNVAKKKTTTKTTKASAARRGNGVLVPGPELRGMREKLQSQAATILDYMHREDALQLRLEAVEARERASAIARVDAQLSPAELEAQATALRARLELEIRQGETLHLSDDSLQIIKLALSGGRHD